MWRVNYDIEKEEDWVWLFNYAVNPLQSGDIISIEVSNEKSAKLLKQLFDEKLDERDAVYESWIYEVPEEYDDSIIDPYYENGVKESEFY